VSGACWGRLLVAMSVGGMPAGSGWRRGRLIVLNELKGGSGGSLKGVMTEL